MNRLIGKVKSISKLQLLAVVLIIIGALIMIPRGRGMFKFSQEVEFARQHDFQSGNISPDLLRPWMTVRYIAVSYAVPQKYIFDAVGIPPRRENSMISVSRLNKRLELGTVDGQPELLHILRDTILAYRANPVATGLVEQGVRDWMTIQYIANSTGIPVETIFLELDLPVDGNACLPLGPLSDKVHYPGGPRALEQALQRLVDTAQVHP